MSEFIKSLNTGPRVRLVHQNGEEHFSSSPDQTETLELDTTRKDIPISTQVYRHVKSKNILRHNGKNAFYFNKAQSRYVKLSEQDWTYLLKLNLNENSRHKVLKKHCKEALDLLLTDPLMYMDFDTWRSDNPLKIPCSNGVIDLETEKLIPITPDLPISVCFNFEYTSNAKLEDATEFTKFAKTSLNLDNDPTLTQLLLCCFGYILSGSNSWRKSFFCIGPTACGKSVTADFLQAVVRDENCSTLSLQKLGLKFSTQVLSESVVNITRELANGAIKHADTFKSVVSGDKISDQKKYGDEFTFSPKSKLFVCSNVLPSLGKNQSDGSDEAIFDRIIFLPFARTIPPEERNPKLLDALLKERDIVFSVAVDYFYFLHTSNYKTPKCPSSESCMLTFRREQAVFETWAEDHLIIERGARVSIAAINDSFKEYCWDNCLVNPIGNTEIKAFFRHKYPSEVRYDKFRYRNDRVLWGFEGVRLVKPT